MRTNYKCNANWLELMPGNRQQTKENTKNNKKKKLYKCAEIKENAIKFKSANHEIICIVCM